MEPSKTGKGILARLEHKVAKPPRHIADSTPPAGRGAALVVSAGMLIGALLAWWLYSGPSPVIVQETLPQLAQAAPPQPEPAPVAETAAAAIVDEAPQPIAAASPRPQAVSAPIATIVMRPGRAVVARQPAKQKAKPKRRAEMHEKPRRASVAIRDTDVALLSALMAHAGDHDVVETRAGDTTESLLRRCRRVGGEEGRLCRVRICSSSSAGGACHIE